MQGNIKFLPLRMGQMSDKISGKAIGGKARSNSLTKERRKEIAKKASDARWKEEVIKATHGSEDHPLTIGSIKIPCYVLSNGSRVLVQRSMASAIGISDTGGQRITIFTGSKALSEFIAPSLLETLNNPIVFKTPLGNTAHGYDASILVDICDAVLAARKANKLLAQQDHIATQCEILVRGFARVGIIALIDEVTGYQEDRAKNSLAKILEAFVTSELQPWIKTFPIDYYKELFRLRGLKFPSASVNNPSYFGHLTNNIVYKRLAPGVLVALKKNTPKSKNGNNTAKLFQSLTNETGYPKLKEHLGSVITLMKLSKDYNEFTKKLDFIHPLYEVLSDIDKNDIGIGI